MNNEILDAMNEAIANEEEYFKLRRKYCYYPTDPKDPHKVVRRVLLSSSQEWAHLQNSKDSLRKARNRVYELAQSSLPLVAKYGDVEVFLKEDTIIVFILAGKSFHSIPLSEIKRSYPTLPDEQVALRMAADALASAAK